MEETNFLSYEYPETILKYIILYVIIPKTDILKNAIYSYAVQ